MQQLTGVDATFLHMETHATFGHVSSVTVVDPSTAGAGLTLETVRNVLESRLPRLPLLRKRLVEVPLGLDRPYWADDPAFDLEFHLREVALPAPGDRYQLAEQVARISARPLDRTRPLWELYLISGLEGGQAAMMAKFHHAAVDGVAGAEIMSTILDTSPEPADTGAATPGWRPPPLPSDGEMLVRGLTNLTLQPLRALEYQQRVLRTLPRSTLFLGRKAVPALLEQVNRLTSGGIARDGRLLESPPVAAPRTSFNRPITPHRRWAFGTVSLDTVKAIKNAHRATVNDVVMAVCAGAMRRWLQAHDELPDVPLLAMVPLSVRTKETGGQPGNAVSSMIGPLPTHLADPVERLRAAHESMRAAKEQHQAIGAETLQDMAQFAMPALAARAARVAASMRFADYVNPPFNLTISNVPGPRSTLYLAGAEVLGMYPVSVVTDGQGLNITVQSYRDALDFGLTACRELVPDVWDLLGYLTESVDELAAAASAPA